jgi:hypothetical protein
MTPEEENYWRGYIDAKVEDLGKVRAFQVSEEQKLKKLAKLVRLYLGDGYEIN